MRIVEYNDTYAAKVADMWNRSASNWGNDTSISTEESVIAKEANAGNIKLYLAIDNDEVVGYCSFSEYEYDEGASYLPLLNVRPDYHGKKVGKKLILKVLEDAVKSEWPRFDLFTWSGNIKAMPLYKKCGFFWEKKNNTVHLMNFIPYLYQTEALSKYLDKIDWYQDSKRIIDMNQDGDTRNDFDYYRYDFSNDNTKLAFEFEKTGRGLRYIETPDYIVEMTIPKNELVYETEYEVDLRFVNKSGKPLEIEYEGLNNKSIQANFSKKINIQDEKNIKERFFVGKIEKAIDKFKTYPVVDVNVKINGEAVNLRLGLEPKNPVYVNFQVKEYNHLVDREYTGYLDIENNLEDESTFEFSLPKDKVEVINDLRVTLKPKEKRSIQVQYRVVEFGFYNQDVIIKYQGKETSKKVQTLIKGYNHSFTALTDFDAYVVCGNYTVVYNKQNHVLTYLNDINGERTVAFRTPKIGLPYSLEFSNTEPIFEFPSSNIMEIRYQSKVFKNVELINRIENNNGILKVTYELVNKGQKRTLALSVPFWHTTQDAYIPYKGKILKTTKNEGSEIGNLENDYLDENWMYNYKNKVGMTWHKEEDISITGWRMSLTKKDITLGTGESYKTKGFYVSYTHPNVESFRHFSGNFDKREKMSFFEYDVNGGNPFSNKDITISLINNKKAKVEGTISVDQSKVDLIDKITVSPGLKTITLDIEEATIETKRQVFTPKGDITLVEEDGIFTVNNGLLSYKASTDYSDAVYSLIFDNKEWFDSNYPKPKERAWWGKFCGGITQRFNGVQSEVVLQEKRSNEFVSLKDNFNNCWQGIKTTVEFIKDKDNKGLQYELYTVTLPGVPLLYTFTNVINQTGKVMLYKNLFRTITVKVDENRNDVRYSLDNAKYKLGNVEIYKETKKLLTLESTRDYKMAFYNKENILTVESQPTYTNIYSEGKITIPDGGKKQYPGDYIIFSKEELKKDYLIDLENIKFEV